MMLSRITHSILTEDVLKALEAKGFYTVLDFLRVDNRLIEKYALLTYPEVTELRKYLAKSFSAPPIKASTYYTKLLTHSALIPTGLSELDKLLQGGLFTGIIYEFCGVADSGKLHFTFGILANILRNDRKIYFLDTKKDFSAKHLKAKLEEKNKEDCLNLLSNVLVKQIEDKYELITALFDVKRELEEGMDAKVIFIHSISTLFFSSSDHSENNHILNHLANILRYMAVEKHVVIIVTNLITTWVSGSFENCVETVEKFACGEYWHRVPNVRVKMEKISQADIQLRLSKHFNVVLNDKCIIPLSTFNS